MVYLQCPGLFRKFEWLFWYTHLKELVWINGTVFVDLAVPNRTQILILHDIYFMYIFEFGAIALSFNPLNPIVHFWLHHTAHCMEKIVSARLRMGSASAERVGQGEVGEVTRRVTGTWWLLGLALKRPWLVPGGPPPVLTA